jgi:hypothetical protein
MTTLRATQRTQTSCEPLDSEMSLVVSRASLLADVYVVCGTGVASAASGISTTQMHPLPGRF